MSAISTPTELRATHATAQKKVLAQQNILLSSSSTSTSTSTKSYPLDNIAEGTWTLFSPQLLSHLPASWFRNYDPECDEWVLEFYDTDFANELYPGSFRPGELLVTLHVGEVHAQFEPVRRPEFASSSSATGGEGGEIELVQTFKYARPGAESGSGSGSGSGKRKVTAKLRFLGDGCLTIKVPVGDLLPGKAGKVGGGADEAEDVVTLYGTFEDDGGGEDEFEYVAAGEAGGEW